MAAQIQTPQIPNQVKNQIIKAVLSLDRSRLELLLLKLWIFWHDLSRCSGLMREEYKKDKAKELLRYLGINGYTPRTPEEAMEIIISIERAAVRHPLYDFVKKDVEDP